jgi:hypothetical protein
MTSVLSWLESTWLSTTLRDSPNVFVYPTVLAFHTLGLAFLVGISSAISLRILGVAPEVPLGPLRKFVPLMWLGFVVNALSGILLLLIEPTKFLTMLDFYIKLVAIAGAAVCSRLLYWRRFRLPAKPDKAPLTARDKFLASAVLVLWGAAITAGRLTAYDNAKVQRATAIATVEVASVMLIVGFVAVRLFRPLRALLAGRASVAPQLREGMLK